MNFSNLFSRFVKMAVLPSVLAAPLHAEIKYVLHITVDGLRADTLVAAINSSPNNFQNFIKIRREGATTFNARCDFDYSETLPNHCGVVTARPVTAPTGSLATVAHRYNSNTYQGSASGGDSIHQLGSANYSYKFGTFDMAHDRGFSTAIFGGKTRLNLFVDSYNATKGAADLVEIGGNNGKNKIDFSAITDAGSTAELASIQNQVVSAITENRLANYSFIHFTDTDTGTTFGGHFAGWESTGWLMAASGVDGYLGSIFTAIAANSNYAGKVAIVLTADHGGGGGGAGPGATPDKNHSDASSVKNYTIPLLMWGPGIPAGANAYSLFKNRIDPSVRRPTAATNFTQPLRNVDSGNIALTLLGTPAITGSFFKPEIIDTPSVTVTGGSATIRWPKYLTGYQLQVSTELNSGSWSAVVAAPAETEEEFTVMVPATLARQFWRLAAPK